MPAQREMALSMQAAAVRRFSDVPVPHSVLDLDAIVRASPAKLMSPPQRRAWANVFATLRANGSVSLVMIGGSMARGQGCTALNAEQATCAYAGRLASWLRGRFPWATILFDNRAVGGMTTGAALLSLPSLSQPVYLDSDAPLTRGEGDMLGVSTIGGDGGGGSADPMGGRAAASSASTKKKSSRRHASPINSLVIPVGVGPAATRPRASIILIDYAINDALYAHASVFSRGTLHLAAVISSLWLLCVRICQICDDSRACARPHSELQVANSKLDADVYRNAKRVLRPLNQSAAVFQQVVAASEAALRYLLGSAKVASALLLVEGSCWRSTRNTSAAHGLVARHYGVPFLDFAAVLRKVCTRYWLAIMRSRHMCPPLTRPLPAPTIS